MTTRPNLYDELSRRLYGFSREIIKREFYKIAYSDDSGDPWTTHLIRTEFRKIMAEWHGKVIESMYRDRAVQLVQLKVMSSVPEARCETCLGDGWISGEYPDMPDTRCKVCNGSGKIGIPENFTAK